MSAALCKAGRSFASSDATDAKPLARLMLNESGLPKLKSDQPVRFFFEAFPYQRYGAVSGKLDWVSPSAVTGSDRSAFRWRWLHSMKSANRRHLAVTTWNERRSARFVLEAGR